MSNDKTYFSETVRRAARPRSRRRREQGTGGAVRGYSGGGTTSAAPAPMGHSHTNKELLDSLRTDELNYLYKVRLNPGGSEAGQDKIRAGQADTAHDLTPDSPAYNRFLRKDRDDKAAGVVDFLKGLRLAGKALTGILTTGDTAGANEANVLSALRTLATFLRKDRPDAMPHLLKLLDGVETGTFAAGRTGGRIDKQGNGELGSLTLRDLLTAVRLIADGVRSKNYTPGDMGTGFGLTTGEGGSRLEVDYLLVRRVATFLELLIREMRHVGGTLVLSGASGKVVRVEDKPTAWRVHFKTREDGTTVAHGFTVGAQARCQTYNRTSGNTYYWRLVTAVGDDWVELSKSDYDRAAPAGTARTAPAVGDELVQLGHRTDSRQTGAIVLDTVGEGAPSIRLLKDIRSYSLTDANVRVLLSPSTVRVIADEVSFSSGKTVKETIKDSSNAAVTAAKEYVDGQKKGIDDRIGEVSGKVDNLVIGGRNLLRYSALEQTPLNNIVYGRGSYTTAVDTATLCEGQRSLKVTASKVGSVGVTDNFVWEAWNVVRQSECVTVSFYAKAATADTRFSVRMGGDVCNFPQTVSLSTDWQRFEMTFREPGRKWTCIVAWFDRPGTVWIALPKMELGTKPTDWTPAPEDVDNSIDGIRTTANQASSDAGDAKQKAGEAATSASKAESSAKNAEDSANAAKGKATEAAGSAKTASDKATNAANSASAAAGSAQTAATNAQNAAGSAQTAATDAAQAKADADAAAQSANASKADADAAKTRLDNWAADNVISPMEKQGLRDETARIDADKSQVAAGYAKYGLGSYQSFTDAYNAYRAVLVTLSAKQPETISIPADFATKQRNYYTQRSTALTRIADAAKEYVDGLQIGGRNYFGQHKGVATNPAGALSPDNNGVVFRNRDLLNCRIEKLNLPGVGWYAVSMFIRATKACTIASINLCDAVSKDKTLENVSVTTSFRYITGVFHAERYINDNRWNGFLDFESSIDPSIEVTVRDLMITPGNQPMSWVPAPEDIAAEIAAKAEAARQAAQAEAIGLNKWIAQAYYTGENKAATPPKLEDIAGRAPTRTLELKDAQFNLSGGGSVFNMDNYTGIRTTYVYLEADYNLTTGIQHDDAGSLYVNGALVASGPLLTASWKSVTLPLKRGWNRIDGLWNEGGGGDFFKFQAPLENDAHIIQLACRPNVSIDPMRAVTMTTLTEKYSEIAKTNESIKLRVGETEKSIQEVDNKVKGFTTVDKDGRVLIKPESVWAGVETKVKQLSNESLKKLSVGGRNLILSSDTSAAPVAMKAPTGGTAYKIFPVKTTLVKHDCQEEEPYTLTVWYTSTSQFPFESFPIGGKPGGDDWSVRFIASEGQITQEGGMKKCVMQAVVPKGGRVLYNPTVGFIYGANIPCNMNLYRVKLERGQKSTDWTPAPEDLPTIDTLSRTGIDIQQGVITLDAQKVKVQNGSQTMAMFEGGKLKAELIDAKRIKANDILSQNIVVGNNATITNLRAKNAVIEGKLEAASGSTIGGMTSYSSCLGFEAQRGTASERILRIGTQAIPLSTGFHGMLYLTDKQRDAFKTIVYIESLGKEEKRWNLADARVHNKAIHIASGTLRVDPGNLVDMPGVLLSGRVSETGHVEYEYGRRRMGMGLAAFSVQLHDGRDWVGYTVTHNLGHTNYTVQATPYSPGASWRKYMMHVDQLTANYFTLLCIDTGTDNRQVKGSFMFTVVGENTAD